MSLQKKSVRELRLMFDNTAYFDTDQITSILMVTVTAVAIPPAVRAPERYFLNVSENKSSERKLSCRPPVMSNSHYEVFEDIWPPKSGLVSTAPQTPFAPQHDLLDPLPSQCTRSYTNCS